MHAVVPELKTWCTNEAPDVIGWKASLRKDYPDAECTVIECKTSRADFLADRAKPFRKDPTLGMGGWRWMFTPVGLVKPTELPEGWGLAECTERGVRKVHKPKEFLVHNWRAEALLLVSCLRRVQFPLLKFAPAHFEVGEEPGEGESGGLEP